MFQRTYKGHKAKLDIYIQTKNRNKKQKWLIWTYRGQKFFPQNERIFMGKITKRDLIRELAKRAGCTQPVAQKVYEALSEIAMEEMAKENAITLFKGLVIYGTRRKSRMWENPLIGGSEEIPERVVPRARFSDDLKARLRDLYK